MLQQIKETADFLKGKINSIPKLGIILGTGLGGLVKMKIALITQRYFKNTFINFLIQQLKYIVDADAHEYHERL